MIAQYFPDNASKTLLISLYIFQWPGSSLGRLLLLGLWQIPILLFDHKTIQIIRIFEYLKLRKNTQKRPLADTA